MQPGHDHPQGDGIRYRQWHGHVGSDQCCDLGEQRTAPGTAATHGSTSGQSCARPGWAPPCAPSRASFTALSKVRVRTPKSCASFFRHRSYSCGGSASQARHHVRKFVAVLTFFGLRLPGTGQQRSQIHPLGQRVRQIPARGHLVRHRHDPHRRRPGLVHELRNGGREPRARFVRVGPDRHVPRGNTR